MCFKIVCQRIFVSINHFGFAVENLFKTKVITETEIRNVNDFISKHSQIRNRTNKVYLFFEMFIISSLW